VYNPFFLAGIETMAYELWEQLGRRAPAALVLPVGNGTLFLGIHRGFQRLHQAGLIDCQPRLFAVQAAACAPVYKAWREGQDKVDAVEAGPTAARGIAVGQPARGTQILAAVRATDGAAVRVAEDAIEQARNQLACSGFYVEETAAVSMAAVIALRGQLSALAAVPVVVPLTGHGLKT
jgi:threonine synthase